MDRYDEIMVGLYRGIAPAWLPEARRALFMRESRRRCCALGQALVATWTCTTYYARGVISEDFALDIFAGWPAHLAVAPNVTTALYLALDGLLVGRGPLWELFQYESLVVEALACDVAIPCVAGVFCFEHDVAALRTHMQLYESAAAPARFARDFAVTARPTYIARTRVGERWHLEEVQP
jgi:hypothetical protein